MEAELQNFVAFHLTGKRPGPELERVDNMDLRPALFARYRDLTRLRYDYPIVLLDGAKGSDYLQPLSNIVDAALREVGTGDDGTRVARHTQRLEQQIRVLLAEGMTGTLTTVFDAAAGRLQPRTDEPLQQSLDRARAALKVDGELLDCDERLPARLLRHVARLTHEAKARRFREEVGRLIQKLTDILRADFARTEAGRTPASLRAAMGSLHADAFDFDAMAKLLATGAASPGLPESRRTRIRALLDVLRVQRFYAADLAPGVKIAPYTFVFDSCGDALAAYRERLPRMVELARTIAMAELEIAGEYREARHDAYFDAFGENGLDPKDLALFPDYVVCITAARLDVVENATLSELLSAGLPVKVLVQTDDLLDESPLGDHHLGFGMRSRQLAHMAMALQDVYVLQAAASHLVQMRGRLRAALEYRGPALLSVFCPARGRAGDPPPYLLAAAAVESRAFPAFTYDPAAGSDWAARFDLSANPQVEGDWPQQTVEYEDEEHQRVTQDVTFTLPDFVACDTRFARHFARVSRAQWNPGMVAVADALATPAGNLPDKVPCLLVVDRHDHLHKLLVDDKLMRETRRCRDLWHSLQELYGVHNSHARRLLAAEREAQARLNAEAASVVAASVQVSVAAPAAAAAAVVEPAGDDPYIETARCTSCNECTNLNDKLFGYDENKQAFIRNPDAGTFAQLVEAAENCQVSIIHPGKPRNPKEPGLDELFKRAEPFR